MRLTTLLTSALVLIVLCFGAVSGRVLIDEAGGYLRVRDAVAAAHLAELILAASTQLSFERGPVNSALGSSLPLPSERREKLDHARAATDQALDAAILAIAGTHTLDDAEIARSLTSARESLKRARATIDGLLARPLASRAGTEISGAIDGMISLISGFAPALNVVETTMTKTDPRLTGLISAARLATEVREYAGQLGSVFTAALVAQRPLTQIESARFERISGHLDSLHEQLWLAYAKSGPSREIAAALSDADRIYFGAGRSIAENLKGENRYDNPSAMTPAAFAAIYVPDMLCLVTLRDTIIKNMVGRIEDRLATSAISLAVMGAALVVAAAVILALSLGMRAQLVQPLHALTHAIDGFARRNYKIDMPRGVVIHEIKRMEEAVESLKRVSIAAEQSEARIAYMARHDALTGAGNRLLLHENMKRLLEAPSQLGRCAVICIDLDRFKQVNDTLGHPAGDALLCEVAARLRDLAGPNDTVARHGGDEFVILLANVDGEDEACRIGHKIIETLSGPYDLAGYIAVVGASAGIAVEDIVAAELEILLRKADLALYRAKQEGSGNVRLFKPEMDNHAKQRHHIELSLRGALSKNEFELHFQPQLSFPQRRITGFEALIRWKRGGQDVILPSSFINVAEDIGEILPIGAWVLREACREAVRWPGNLSVAVNVSAIQFMRGDILGDVMAALRESKLSPARLELEITETILLQKQAAIFDTLRNLRMLGVRIALDDFGTGYSSLGYLRDFPLDKLKIDRSFVAGLEETRQGTALVGAIIGIGRALGIRVCAEGVETEQQLAWLALEGCHEFQGYLFGRPRPANELPAFFDDFRSNSAAA